MALVADYGSDSTSDSSDDDDNGVTDAKINVLNEANKEIPLIPADVILDQAVHGQRNSIFANPFLEAEKCQQNMLEKHVKMTNVKEVEMKGKNICYRFQKGKCPYGSKCKYFHPQTILATNETEVIINNFSPVTVNDAVTTNEQTDGDDSEIFKPKKKRYGLKDSLQPPKGYIKMYNKHKK